MKCARFILVLLSSIAIVLGCPVYEGNPETISKRPKAEKIEKLKDLYNDMVAGGTDLLQKIKTDVFMDDQLIKHCGTSLADDDGESGYVYSHTGKVTAALGGDITSYDDNTDCVVLLDATHLGPHWCYMMQFIGDVELAGTGGSCDVMAIYDGLFVDSNLQTPIISFCGDANVPTDPIETPGPVASVRFKTNNDGSTGNGFQILYTAFTRNNTCGPGQFQCDTDRCILEAFTCDGATQCLDTSDESEDYAGCTAFMLFMAKFFGLGFYTVLIILVIILLVILIPCGCMCYFCCCKKRKRQSRRNAFVNNSICEQESHLN